MGYKFQLELESEDTRRQMNQLEDREKTFSFIHLFHSCLKQMELSEAHPQWGGQLDLLHIQIKCSSYSETSH